MSVQSVPIKKVIYNLMEQYMIMFEKNIGQFVEKVNYKCLSNIANWTTNTRNKKKIRIC